FELGRRMVGHSLLEAYKDHPTVPGYIRRGLAGETVSYSVEVQGLILDVWLGPLRDASGKLEGAIGVCTDVTEARRLQSRVIQHAPTHAMGPVAASVAHETNNPPPYVPGGPEEASEELDAPPRGLDRLATAGGAAVAAAVRHGIARLRDLLGP